MHRRTCPVPIFVLLLTAALLAPSRPFQPSAVHSQDKVAQDPLPSWNDGPAKQSILHFLSRVTRPGSADFVPIDQRIATFDNDGTLWCEQPLYVQSAFIFDRIRTLAPRHPAWKEQEPFASVLKGDLKEVQAGGNKSLDEMIVSTYAGMSTDAFEIIVKDWLATARHPRFDRPFTELIYQPMLELLVLLRAHEFKTYIVSGGGVEFMRTWTEKVYGIPPEQVIGSTIKTKFEMQGAKSVMMRLPAIDFIDDKGGKPVSITKFIGRRPVMAFGNSDGDLEMLEYTTGSPGARFGLIVHHTDAVREYAYDRQSSIGRLDHALNAAKANQWIVVDMKHDWKTIFPAP